MPKKNNNVVKPISKSGRLVYSDRNVVDGVDELPSKPSLKIRLSNSFYKVRNQFTGVRSRASKILVSAKKTRAASIARERLRLFTSLPVKPPQLLRWDLLGVSLSYLWGFMNRRTLPTIMRRPVYSLWAYTTRCNLDEMRFPLETYPSLCDFFTRPLKDGAREISTQGMASPVDGRVVVCGEVTSDLVTQVKGLTYTLSGFLGTPFSECKRNPENKLYHCVLYLAPGDYHRIHSPEDWQISESRHFPGTLFPIAPSFGRLIPNLLALNERVVMQGSYAEGFYSLTAVGAYNVGSISLNFDQTVKTNIISRDFRCKNLQYFSYGGVGSHAYQQKYIPAFNITKGEEIAYFNFGSTVVLIFEAPEFEFAVNCGDYVQMGSLIGTYSERHS